MKEWGGQRYNTDFEPIDEQGNVLGPKDLAASQGWTDANEPWRNTPGWHGQPLSAEQSAGLQASNPAAWQARQTWRAANPTNALGAPIGGGPNPGMGGGGGIQPPPAFSWSRWDWNGAGDTSMSGLGTLGQPPAGSNPVGSGGAAPMGMRGGQTGMVRAPEYESSGGGPGMPINVAGGVQTGGGDPQIGAPEGFGWEGGSGWDQGWSQSMTNGDAQRAPQSSGPDDPMPMSALGAPTYTAPTLNLPDTYVAPTRTGRTDFTMTADPLQFGDAATFTAPDAAALANDPGYQFRERRGLQALENANAARGLSRTGGAFKGLQDYASELASQEYGNAFGRALDTFNTNQASRYGAYDRNNAANRDLFDRSFQTWDANETGRDTQFGQDTAAAQSQYDRATDAAMSRFASQFQGSQAELAPKMEAWRAGLAQDEAERARRFAGEQAGLDRDVARRNRTSDDAYREMVFKSDDNFRRAVYGNDQEYRRYRDSVEDAWKRTVMDEERQRFLAELGAR